MDRGREVEVGGQVLGGWVVGLKSNFLGDGSWKQPLRGVAESD